MIDLALRLLGLPLAVFATTATVLACVTTLLATRQRRLRLSGVMSGTAAAPPAGFSARFPRLWQQVIRLTDRLDILRGEDPERVAALLASAGYPDREWRIVYAFAKTFPLAAGSLLTGLWLAIAILAKLDWIAGTFVILAATLMFMRLPDIWLGAARKRRNRAIRRAIPGMLELLAIACEAGMAPGPALRRIAAELAPTCPDLAIEIDRLLAELSLMTDRAEAYDRLARRIDLPEVGTFAQAMAQAERFGTPFAAALRAMMEELRTHALLRIEEKAGRVPVLMAVPLIAFIMPALFVIIAGPAALGMADALVNGGLAQ